MNVKTSFIWNTINSAGRLAITFLSTLLLARILTPADFGTYGILMIFISISELLADSGMGGYLVKKQDATDIDYDTLLVYNMTVSVILYVSLFCFAPSLSEFYEEPSLVISTRILGLVIIIQSLSITANAKLIKEFSFKTLALASVCSCLIGLIIALFWAFLIGGYMTLIVQHLTCITVNTIWIIIAAHKLPRFRFSTRIFKEQFSFGINLMGSTLVQSVSNNICNNIIAKVFNVSLSGQFVQSTKLQNIPTALIQNILDKTFFPIFSKENKDLDKLIKKARVLWRFVFAFGFLGLSSIICFSKPIILLTLGEQWLESESMFKLLMIASFPMLIKFVNRNLLKSLGFTFSIFLMELLPIIIMGIMLLAGIWYSNLSIIILSIIICQVFSCILSIYYIIKQCRVTSTSILSDILTFSPLAILPTLFSFCCDFNLLFVFEYLIGIIILLMAYILCGNNEILHIYQYLRFKK